MSFRFRVVKGDLLDCWPKFLKRAWYRRLMKEKFLWSLLKVILKSICLRELPL